MALHPDCVTVFPVPPTTPHNICTYSPCTPIPEPTVTHGQDTADLLTLSWNNDMLSTFCICEEYHFYSVHSFLNVTVECSVLLPFLLFICFVVLDLSSSHDGGLTYFMIRLLWLICKSLFQMDASCSISLWSSSQRCFVCAGLAQRALILLHLLSSATVTEAFLAGIFVCSVWEPQFWILAKLF